MVTTKLVGGYANQLAQIMTTIAYALQHGMPYAIPTKTTHPRWKTYRVGHVHYEDIPAQGWPHYRCHDLLYDERPYSISFKPIPFHDRLVIEGHFQSWKYWLSRIEEIRTIFDLPVSSLGDTMALHVRRGDYLTMTDKLPPVSKEYIQRAIGAGRVLGYEKFLCFSDDLDYVREIIPSFHLPDYIEINYSEDRTDEEDFALIASCGSVICANSSFSLLASYLNPHPSKQVICPKQWFGHGFRPVDTADLYPPEAIII